MPDDSAETAATTHDAAPAVRPAAATMPPLITPAPAAPAVEPGPAPAVEPGLAPGAATDLRLSDRVGVAMTSDQIIITNGTTGQRKAFAKVLEPLLDQLLSWTTTAALVQRALELGDGVIAVDDVVALVADLARLDVLISRRQEWSGARLGPPGAGWTAAMRYLNDTRTRRDTVYAVPVEFYAALAQKAAIDRQPSAFYERVDAPFRALSDPDPAAVAKVPGFAEVMLQRRTARRFADRPIREAELSALLHFGWGMTASVPNPLGDFFIRKTSPSGGSLHPIEVYPIVLRVDGVAPGCYHYSVRRHGLEELSRDDPAAWIVAACGDQAWVAEAAVIFLCTAFLPRTAWKYDYARVARAVISEIGYTGQSAFLAATWLGLGAFTTAALRDEVFEDVLGLDPTREPVFSVTGVGNLEPELHDHARPRAERAAGVEDS